MNQNERHNDEEIKREAPTLFGISQENTFEVPANYFDSLADNIGSFVEREEARERIRLQETSTAVIPEETPTLLERLVGLLKPRILAPTLAIIAVVIGGFFFMNPAETSEDEIMMSALENIEGVDGFDFELIDDEEFFAEAYSEESVDALLAEDAALEELGENILIEYLIENNIDLETIIEEL